MKIKEITSQHRRDFQAVDAEPSYVPGVTDEKDAARWRKARMIFAIEDIERADAEMACSPATEEENEKADAAIDAARDR